MSKKSNFNIQSEEEKYKLSERYELFKEIYNETTQKCGTFKIKRFKLKIDSSDLMITKYTAAKKRKLNFEPRTLQLQYTEITTIMNELALNKVINLHAFFSNQWRSGDLEGYGISYNSGSKAF